MNRFPPPLNKEHIEKDNKIVLEHTPAQQQGVFFFHLCISFQLKVLLCSIATQNSAKCPSNCLLILGHSGEEKSYSTWTLRFMFEPFPLSFYCLPCFQCVVHDTNSFHCQIKEGILAYTPQACSSQTNYSQFPLLYFKCVKSTE